MIALAGGNSIKGVAKIIGIDRNIYHLACGIRGRACGAYSLVPEAEVCYAFLPISHGPQAGAPLHLHPVVHFPWRGQPQGFLEQPQKLFLY